MIDARDPRVLFAAERTLLAWTRTSLTLMGFGFLIERFGLFLQAFGAQEASAPYQGVSFWVGLAFIALGTSTAALTAVQYRSILRGLPAEGIPPGYWKNLAPITSALLVALGVGLIVYVVYGFR